MLLPLLLSFDFTNELLRNPLFCVALIAITSVLMVSRVPTPSLKYTRLNRDGWVATVMLAGALAPLAIYVPWLTLVVGLLTYLATIPFVIRRSHFGGGVVQPPSPVPMLSEDGHD